MASVAKPKPKLLVIGGSFAGVTLAVNARKYFDTTIVDRKQYFELYWAAPRAAVDEKVAERFVWDYTAMASKIGKVICSGVKKLGPKQAELEDGQLVEFDYVAICTGTAAADSAAKSSAVTREERLRELKALRDQIKAAKKIVVVGGGPVGVEFAAEIVDAYAGKDLTIVHGQARLLSGNEPKMGALAQEWFEAHKVKVLLNQYIKGGPPGTNTEHGPGTVTLTSGEALSADVVLWLTGMRPCSSFMAQELVGCVSDSGHIKVEPTLQVVGQPHMFALGDVNSVQEFKQAFFAVKQAEMVATSLRLLTLSAQLKQAKPPRLPSWKPNMGKPIMIVTLGRSAGACQFGGWACGGCCPTNIKSKGLFVDQYRSQFGIKG